MFDAIVLADSAAARQKLLGLTIAERGRRVAGRMGARRVLVLGADGGIDALPSWAAELGTAELLVIRVTDQLVHLPLVRPLVAAAGARRIAVGPDGGYAGALWAGPEQIAEVITAILANPTSGDVDVAASWSDAVKVEHGDIARHPVTTPAERKAATKMLLRILIKPAEDSPVSRYIYRPLSRPLTQLLLHTPITANQISYFVGVLGLFGCYLTTRASQASLIWGAALVFVSGVIDGCDGEVSRLRLTSSTFGAWLDTVIDELTTFTYLISIGYHTYVHHPEGWVGASIVVGGVCYVISIYSIYYFCIVVLKAGGSQYYQGDLEIIDAPEGPTLRPRHKAPSTLPPAVQKLGLIALYMIRRDFINLAALALTFFDLYVVIYGGIWVGAVVAALIVIPEHLKLRGQLRELARRGVAPRYVAA